LWPPVSDDAKAQKFQALDQPARALASAFAPGKPASFGLGAPRGVVLPLPIAQARGGPVAGQATLAVAAF